MIKRPRHRRAGRGRHGKMGGGLKTGMVKGIGLNVPKGRKSSRKSKRG